MRPQISKLFLLLSLICFVFVFFDNNSVNDWIIPSAHASGEVSQGPIDPRTNLPVGFLPEGLKPDDFRPERVYQPGDVIKFKNGSVITVYKAGDIFDQLYVNSPQDLNAQEKLHNAGAKAFWVKVALGVAIIGLIIGVIGFMYKKYKTE